MAKRIAPVVKGSEDTLLNAERANELIGTVNSLANMTFIPTNAAKLEVGPEGGAVLTFNLDVLGGGGNTGDIYAIVREVIASATVTITCTDPGVMDINFTIPPAPV
jgi:hypothetical protein